MHEDPHDLFAALLAGDDGAFDRLILATQREVAVFLAARGAPPELLDEVVQDAYVRAYQHRRDWAGGDVLAWLKGLARNCLREALRARACRRERGGLDELAVLIAGDGKDGAGVFHDRQVERLRSCLEKLPEDSRRLLMVRYGEGRSLGDLARDLRRSANALACLLQRLRTRLLTCMGDGDGA